MSKPRVIYADRTQMRMESLALDDLVAPDHVVREVWALVLRMDLTALYDAIGSREGDAGAPCFDPRTLLCLWIYATVDGIGSGRRLARLTEEHAAYRWITGGDAINHHTLSTFRSCNEALLDRLLSASLAVLAESGLVDMNAMTVAHDGVRVRASAGCDSLRSRARLEELLETAKARVEQLKTQGDEELSPRREAARERAATERVERLGEALVAIDEIVARRVRPDRKDREVRASTTDPGATMMRMANGGMDLAYNIQYTTEVRTRAITSVRVVAVGSDTGTLAPAMRDHARRCGQLPSRVLADAGFFKYTDIAELESGGCEVLMPDTFSSAVRTQRHYGKEAAPLIERWRARMQSGEGKERFKLRASTAEWTNACVRNRGLRLLTVRGPAKVRTIALWHAVTHNICRIIALLRRQPAESIAW